MGLQSKINIFFICDDIIELHIPKGICSKDVKTGLGLVRVCLVQIPSVIEALVWLKVMYIHHVHVCMCT